MYTHTTHSPHSSLCVQLGLYLFPALWHSLSQHTHTKACDWFFYRWAAFTLCFPSTGFFVVTKCTLTDACQPNPDWRVCICVRKMCIVMKKRGGAWNRRKIIRRKEAINNPNRLTAEWKHQLLTCLHTLRSSSSILDMHTLTNTHLRPPFATFFFQYHFTHFLRHESVRWHG